MRGRKDGRVVGGREDGRVVGGEDGGVVRGREDGGVVRGREDGRVVRGREDGGVVGGREDGGVRGWGSGEGKGGWGSGEGKGVWGLVRGREEEEVFPSLPVISLLCACVQDYDWRQYASADDQSADDHSLRTRLASHPAPAHSPPTLPDTFSAPFEDTLSGSMVSCMQ